MDSNSKNSDAGMGSYGNLNYSDKNHNELITAQNFQDMNDKDDYLHNPTKIGDANLVTNLWELEDNGDSDQYSVVAFKYVRLLERGESNSLIHFLNENSSEISHQDAPLYIYLLVLYKFGHKYHEIFEYFKQLVPNDKDNSEISNVSTLPEDFNQLVNWNYEFQDLASAAIDIILKRKFYAVFSIIFKLGHDTIIL